MAKDQKAKQEGNEEQAADILHTTAKAIGSAAGKIASLAGVTAAPPEPAPPKKSVKPAKLEKKNHSRLPRKEKKALKKQQAAG
jgi:hypothetical protein